MGVKVNTRQVEKLFDDMLDLPADVMKEAGKYFKSITPYREGNAQRNTRTKGLTIYADYGYAGFLDDGNSKQAQDGMSDPTIEYIDREVDNQLKRL